LRYIFLADLVFLITSCNDTTTYNISPGDYVNDNLKAYLQIDSRGSVLIFMENMMVDSTKYLGCTHFKSDYTNFGPSSLYQFCRIETDTLHIGSSVISNPGIVTYRYIDDPYSEYGVIIADYSEIENNGNHARGIKFVKKQ